MKVLVNKDLYNERLIQSIDDLEDLACTDSKNSVGVAYDDVSGKFISYTIDGIGRIKKKEADTFDKALAFAKALFKNPFDIQEEFEKSSDEEELLEIIGDHFIFVSEGTRISDVKRLHGAPISRKRMPYYDNLTIEDFLLLYKIKELERLNLVDENTAFHLQYFFYRRLKLKKLIGKALRKKVDCSELLGFLQEVEVKLNEYHLLENDFDMETIIRTSLLSKEYPKGPQKSFGEIKD